MMTVDVGSCLGKQPKIIKLSQSLQTKNLNFVQYFLSHDVLERKPILVFEGKFQLPSKFENGCEIESC